MFIKILTKKSNKKYAYLVRNFREGKSVKQEIIAYLGEVKDNQIPYLKAAYSKEKPTLVYKDGSTFNG